VTSEVTRVAGVSAVDVDLDAKLVHVHGDDVDREAVVAAIDEAGYDAVPA
jgi:copper chaperone CopZ